MVTDFLVVGVVLGLRERSGYVVGLGGGLPVERELWYKRDGWCAHYMSLLLARNSICSNVEHAGMSCSILLLSCKLYAQGMFGESVPL